MNRHLHPFEIALSVPTEDLEFTLNGYGMVAWADFWLNPRRLRGSDFLMRWSQGRWSEDRIVEAIDETTDYFALPYGLSSTAPDDVREYELYWERLAAAGLGQVKRPDLLVIRKADDPIVQAILQTVGGIQELPFVPEDRPELQAILRKAVLAIECENSLWVARQMPDYQKTLAPQKRLGGRPGLKKNSVLPNVFLKDEDRIPLRRWQEQTNVPIHIWQVFYDLAMGIAFDTAEQLITTGLIEPTVQTFQAPGGATQRKAVYKIYQHYTYTVGESREEPTLRAASITDKNGHILPYVRFEGGAMALSQTALQVLHEVEEQRG